MRFALRIGQLFVRDAPAGGRLCGGRASFHGRAVIRAVLTAFALMPSVPGGCAAQSVSPAVSPDLPWSERIGRSFLLRHPGAVTYDSSTPSQKWNYEQGVMLVALHALWRHSADEKYFMFIHQNLGQYVDSAGRIKTYRVEEYNIDNIGPGRALLAVYERTGEQRYRWAADTLRKQLRSHPRTNEGGFWHKKIYPFQMWLDGLFMAQPFLIRYALMTGDTAALHDIVNQFVWIERHTRDSATGLLYHAWDESRAQRWADPATGRSPHFWGRAMGWYAMALVDVLEVFPASHPGRDSLVAILQRLAEALRRFQDTETGLWYQVVDQGTREGNYFEASASAMLSYSFARGVRRGYLDPSFRTSAERAFRGLLEHRVTVDPATGFVDLYGTCQGAGLGGTPYRDGSYEYYIGERQRTNDLKGIAPLILAAIEMGQ